MEAKAKISCRLQNYYPRKKPSPGGWIRSIEQDGFLFEQGPKSCRPKGAGLATLKLIEELGLQDQVIPGQTTKRFLYVDKKLQVLPSGPLSLLFSPLTKGIIPGIFKDLTTSVNPSEDESIYDFFSRRFNPSIAEGLIDPMTLGIYAGDIRKLSIRSCFPQIYEWERNHGSVIRGAFSRKKTNQSHSSFIKSIQKSSLFSFKKGMETLTHELSRRMESELQLSTTATGLSFHSDHVEVSLSSGQSLYVDHVYSTIPAKDLNLLWPNPTFSRIPANSIGVINLGYRKKVHQKEGFGYLIPSNQGEPILGVVFDSCIFPQQNRNPEETRLTVMMRPVGTEEDMKKIALDSLSRHMHIETPPDTISVLLAKEAIPQYRGGTFCLAGFVKTPYLPHYLREQFSWGCGQ